MGQPSNSTIKKNASCDKFEQAKNWAKPEPHLPPTQQNKSNAYNLIGKDMFDLASNHSKTSKTSNPGNHFFKEKNKTTKNYGSLPGR